MIEFCKKNYGMMFALVILWGLQFTLLPFIHYHPETTHNHGGDVNAHQHQSRYHSTTLEVYAHLVTGHFSNRELDDHFHHSHSSDDEEVNDSEIFVLAKNSKSFKQGLVYTQAGHSTRIWFTNPRVFYPVDPEIPSFKSRLSKSHHSSRSPPFLFL